MSHTYTNNLYHCVFSTKERLNLIPPDLESKLWEYIGGIARRSGMKSLQVGGTGNHIHILLVVPADMAIAKAMQLIKGGSSKWVNERPSLNGRFAWQAGYGAFTVSVSHVPAAMRYIETQKEHHRKRSFEEEYLAFLRRHGIQYDFAHVFG